MSHDSMSGDSQSPSSGRRGHGHRSAKGGAAAAAGAQTARLNGILPYFPTVHAADLKLPPVALTSREALEDFEKRNELSDGETPPQSPLASYENFGTANNGASMKRFPSKHSMRGVSKGIGLAAGSRMRHHGRGGDEGSSTARHSGGGAGASGNKSDAAGGKRRRTRVLVSGVETNPVFGMLCTVHIPVIAKAYEEVTREVRSVATAGMDPHAFCLLLRKLVPHVDLSEDYAEKMFDHFETTMNNQTKRLQFSEFVRAFAQHAAPIETQRSIRFFFSIFEEPDAKGFMPIRSLDGTLSLIHI